jgi:cytochrome P450
MDAPAHIRPELVWEESFDRFTAQGDDPFLALCRMHDLPPVVWTHDASYGRPGWVVTRHAAMSEVLMDPARFAAERKGMIADLLGVPLRLNPIEIDPPAHHGYRRNLNPHFTPKAVQALEQAVRASCAELIESFAQAGGCEFVHDFAIRFPTHVFLDLMALPRDKAADFIQWEDDLMRATDPLQRVAAARSIYAYLEEHKARQVTAPANALNRGIVQGEFHGRPLEHLEAMGMYYVLWVGGLDTVYSTLGWIMRAVATDPGLQDRLRNDPGLIPAAVEEFTRAFAVVVTHREVAQDCEFFGAPLRRGDEINLPLALAGRDPAVFADPHTIDLARKPRHIGFGTGTHNCLGVHLAKRELRIVLEEFLARFRNIRLAEGGECRHHTGRTFGMDHLPLAWELRDSPLINRSAN